MTRAARPATTAWDAIVVGGGVAGFSAACALAEEGARVLLLEARPVAGGRAFSFRDRETGEVVDNGQHVLMGCYRETLAFLRRVGAGDAVLVQGGLRVPMIDRAGRTSELRCPALPSPLHLAAGVLAWDALTWGERWSLLRLAGPIEAARRAISRGDRPAEARDDETVRAWLARHGQASRLVELLWEPLAVAALNQPIDEAAASVFLGVLARMFSDDPDDAALIVPARPLSPLYIDPAVAFLRAHGGEVRLGAAATLAIDDGAVRGVVSRGEHIAAPLVIAAVPWFGLAGLVAGTPTPAPLAAVVADAERTPWSPIVTVNLWFDRRVMDGLLVGLPGRVFQFAFDKGQVFGAGASHLSLVASGAAAVVGRTNDELVATALQETRAALPLVSAARLVRATAVREKRATFSLAPGMPPRPPTDIGVPGLLLAGDWIDTGLPATIESAVVSGHRAAALAGRARRPAHSRAASPGTRAPVSE